MAELHLQEGAFDEAATGVEAIVHTASPVSLDAGDPDELIVPAVKGTVGILHSASRSATVRRVVLLSSCAAVVDPHATGPRVYDETCWNEVDVEEVKTKGRDAPQLSKYRASKTFAERKAWEYYAQAQAKGERWDFVVINPPWVFGPVMHELKGGPETLNDSNKSWYDAVIKGEFNRALE